MTIFRLHSAFICLFSVFATLVLARDYVNDAAPDSVPAVESKRYLPGSEVVLECSNRERHHSTWKNISWEFQPCRSNFKGVIYDPDSVMDLQDYSWKKLEYNDGKRTLEIPNASDENVGLYRCLFNQQILKIYSVDIIYFKKKFLGPPPEVHSLVASNTTVLSDSHLVLQCNATSVLEPRIIWFKACNARNQCLIQEDGVCYCPLGTANSKHVENTIIYINKFNINNVRPNDSGVYACAAITSFGKDYKTVSISVKTVIQTAAVQNERKPLLFLFPFGVALIPAVVWICYYKKQKRNGSPGEQQKQLINKPITPPHSV